MRISTIILALWLHTYMSPYAHSQTVTDVVKLAETPEVILEPLQRFGNGKCGLEFHPSTATPSKGRVDVTLVLDSAPAEISGGDSCSCKTFRPSLGLTHIKRLNGQEPKPRRMWLRWFKVGEPKTFTFTQTVRAGDGKETYLLTAYCGG